MFSYISDDDDDDRTPSTGGLRGNLIGIYQFLDKKAIKYFNKTHFECKLTLNLQELRKTKV